MKRQNTPTKSFERLCLPCYTRRRRACSSYSYEGVFFLPRLLLTSRAGTRGRLLTRTELAKYARHSQHPIHMHEQAPSNVSVRHLIPLGKIPKHIVPCTAIRGVYVREVRNRHGDQVPPRDLGMGGPTARYSDRDHQ